MISVASAMSFGSISAQPADSLLIQITQLRAKGEYQAALDLAHLYHDHVLADTTAYPWEAHDAHRTVLTLEHIGGHPPLHRKHTLADSLAQEVQNMVAAGYLFKAVDLAEDELVARQACFGNQHVETAGSMARTATLVSQRGEFDRAENLLLEAIRITRMELGRSHPAVGQQIRMLGNLYSHMGDYARSEARIREALALFRKLFGEKHVEIAACLRDLAVIFFHRDQLTEAELLLQRSMAMYEFLAGPLYPGRSTHLADLGLIREHQHDYADAEALFRQALDVARTEYGPEHPTVANHIEILANLLLVASGDHAATEQLLRQAMDIRRKFYGEGYPGEWNTLLRLAQVVDRFGNLDQARMLLQEALQGSRQQMGEDHPSVARCYVTMGGQYERQGHYNQAIEYYEKALSIDKKATGSDFYIISRYIDIADCHYARGDMATAEAVLTEAATIYENGRLEAGLGYHRIGHKSPYPRLVPLRLALGDEDGAWIAAERCLGRALADLLLISDQRYLAPEEVDQEHALAASLNQLETEMAALKRAVRTNPGEVSDSLLNDIHTRLLQARSAWLDFQRAMAAVHPVAEGQAFSLKRIQDSIPEKTVLVGWTSARMGLPRAHDIYWGYIIRKEGPVSWAPLAIGQSDQDARHMKQCANEFRQSLQTNAAWPTRVTNLEMITHQARQLWDLWLAPLECHLDGITDLIVLPTGPMLGVPIEALVDSNGTLLTDRYSIAYAPSATVYTWLQERRVGRKPSAALHGLLVGDPPFSDDQLTAMQASATPDAAPSYIGAMMAGELPSSRELRSFVRGDAEIDLRLPRLPRTRDEVDLIAHILPRATLLLGQEASEERLLKLAATGQLLDFNIIHIATHAFVDHEFPEQSAMALSQIGLRDPFEALRTGDRILDGFVTAREVVDLYEFDADLVTLSACQTALGMETGEGYVGLANAFMQAGANNVLVSLWKVDDEATALLMTRFYRNLTGMAEPDAASDPIDKATALREAKRWVRHYVDSSGSRPFQHPVYWSGFILLGSAN